VTIGLPANLLENQRFFISGGGSGVNLAIARTLAECGADLALCGRTQSKLDSAAGELRELGAQVVTSVADVRDPGAVAEAFARSDAEFGPVNGVVCGAAGNFLAPAETISANGFKAVVDIDLLGTFNCASAAYTQLAQTGGSLLFVSGGQSYMAFVHQAHVAAAKAGVDQLRRALAAEWGRGGIRVNSIVPGPVADTEGMRRLTGAMTMESWLESVPLGRFAEPIEIGRVAAFLLSPWASYITGAEIIADGGLTLSGPGHINLSVPVAPVPSEAVGAHSG
jgi:NAD(P)-dependent dehydrogenase (short-subunit alcohol dehydrogenase family)